MKKIWIILILVVISICLIAGLFIFTNFANQNVQTVIIGDDIPLPDRIVYRNSNNQYFEFLKDSDKYNSIIELVGRTLKNYSENGEILSQDDIDNIHDKSFLEFDYETVSKNYIIPFDNLQKNNMVKLADSGGKVCSTDLKNINKLQSKLNKITKDEKSYSFDYREYTSKNQFLLQYKYQSQFKTINYKIFQVKIQDLKTYERYEAMCNLSFDEEITEDLFDNYDLILTVSSVPKITTKVSIGNIRYTYESLPNSYGAQDYAHLLIVSKIVNTDCIYNKDLSTVEQEANLNNFTTNYNEMVNNLDENIFIKDFNKFYEEYNNSSSSITETTANEIAKTAFDEASRIVGNYDQSSQTMELKSVHPNNYFTRKYEEGDYVFPTEITAFCFSRKDDMGNGVEIYIDNKLGKIIGGRSFGD